MRFRNTDQIVADLVRRGCIGWCLKWFCGKMQVNIMVWVHCLPSLYPMLSEHKSSTTEKPQENVHGDHTVYYSKPNFDYLFFQNLFFLYRFLITSQNNASYSIFSVCSDQQPRRASFFQTYGDLGTRNWVIFRRPIIMCEISCTNYM